jgi:hypothetical protein
MRRRDIIALTAATLGALALVAEAAAGQIRGNLTGPARAAGAEVEIDITCHGTPAALNAADKPTGADRTATPDEPATPAPPESYKVSASVPGHYSVNVQQQGDCDLTVTYQAMTASLPIVSQRRSVTYDLVLSVAKGKLRVRRR